MPDIGTTAGAVKVPEIGCPGRAHGSRIGDTASCSALTVPATSCEIKAPSLTVECGA